MTMDKFNDETSTLDNIYDSLVFESKRIGHGLGFFKHPKLYEFLRNKNKPRRRRLANCNNTGECVDKKNCTVCRKYANDTPKS
jgi:hypothetical protein